MFKKLHKNITLFLLIAMSLLCTQKAHAARHIPLEQTIKNKEHAALEQTIAKMDSPYREWFGAAIDEEQIAKLNHCKNSTSGSIVNKSIPDGRTALMLALYYAQFGNVMYLFSVGESTTQTDNEGLNAFHWAQKCRVEKLREKACIIVQRHNAMIEAWFEAAAKGQKDLLQKYREKLDIDIKNNYGDTALTLSAYKGHLDCVKFLVKQKANTERPFRCCQISIETRC